MKTLCTEDCTALLFATSTNIVYLILSAKLTKAVDVRIKSYRLQAPDNIISTR